MAATFQTLGNRGDHPNVVEAAGIETSPLLYRLIYSGRASLLLSEVCGDGTDAVAAHGTRCCDRVPPPRHRPEVAGRR